MATLRRDNLILSTGKNIRMYANIIGISPELEISEGYDGIISMIDYHPSREILLTQAERRELADYAINLWQQFKNLTDEEIMERE